MPLGATAPVIKIAGDNQGLVVGNKVGNPLTQQLQLPFAFKRHEVQVNADDMQNPASAAQLDDAMQEAATGPGQGGDVDILPANKRIFT